MSRIEHSRDRSQSFKNRRKGGMRRKGKTIARHCQRCRKRPANHGVDLCGHCLMLPYCAALDCKRRVDLAGDVCDPCGYALGLRKELAIDEAAPQRTLF